MSELQSGLLEFIQKVRNDPWEFAKYCVWTQDQVDETNPIKPFPTDMLYLKLYFRLWQREKLLIVPKSRRMFMSWANIVLYLWDTMWHVGKHNAFVSKKEDDANDLCKRAKFIYDNIIPAVKKSTGLEIPPAVIPRMNATFCVLDFPEVNSKIEGFPQGADQLRAYTFSGIMADEMAFWEKAQKMYAASMPTLEGGGRFTGISSPGPGFFKAMVFDQMDLMKGGHLS